MQPYDFIDLEQGSDEWVRYRTQHIGSSDAPVIMGVSPWMTPLGLYRFKEGIESPRSVNAAMARGNALEGHARNLLGQHLHAEFSPAVIRHIEKPWMSASLDAISSDGKLIAEIKCPGKEDHELALHGIVPEKYVWQLVHILACADGPEIIHYFSYMSDDDFVCVVFSRDLDMENRLIEKEKEFYDRLVSFQEPDMTDRDFVIMENSSWKMTAKDYLEAAKMEKFWKDQTEELKTKLVRLAGGSSAMGAGIKMQKIKRKGSVNYGSIPALKQIDLEPYRNPDIESWRVTQSV